MLLKLILISTAVSVAFLGIALLNPDAVYDIFDPVPAKETIFPFGDRDWSLDGKSGTADTAIHPFKIDVSEEVLEDLQERLNRTRYIPKDVENSRFTYGFNPAELRKLAWSILYLRGEHEAASPETEFAYKDLDLVDYWMHTYDWRKKEAELNQFSHFKTNIEGLNIHCMVVEPKDVKADTIVMNVLLLHGWPGSFYEFWLMIPHLRKPRRLASGQSLALRLYIPSKPGYAFSDPARISGMTLPDESRLWAKLMKRIGVNKYMVLGIDWGAAISRFMGIMYPENVQGIVLTLYSLPMNMPFFVKTAVAAVAPSLLAPPEEQYKFLFRHVGYEWEDTGFAHILLTKPHSLASGMTSDPAGLAAWIIDKHATQTRPYENALKPDGGLWEFFKRDDLLTNVMLYWVTNSIGTSVRIYKENCGFFGCGKIGEYWFRTVVPVPAVLSDFEVEGIGLQPPNNWVKRYWREIVAFSKHKGGHFSALEQPEALSGDVWMLAEYVHNKK